MKLARGPRECDAHEQAEEPNTEHLLLPSTGDAVSDNELPALDVKVSSYVHFICKSSREEDLRHRF